jgi:hypothetical protein
MKDAHGRDVVVSTYGYSGLDITVTPHSGRNGRIDLQTPAQRDEFRELVDRAATGSAQKRPHGSGRWPAMANDLDRAYIINGSDLRWILGGKGSGAPLVPNAGDTAKYILGAIAKPLDEPDGASLLDKLSNRLRGLTVNTGGGNIGIPTIESARYIAQELMTIVRVHDMNRGRHVADEDDGDEPDPVDPRATTMNEAVIRARRIMSGLTEQHQRDVVSELVAGMRAPETRDPVGALIGRIRGGRYVPVGDDEADELDEPLSYDPEIQVIATIADALETLDSAAQGRVIRWASDRYVSVWSDPEHPF